MKLLSVQAILPVGAVLLVIALLSTDLGSSLFNSLPQDGTEVVSQSNENEVTADAGTAAVATADMTVSLTASSDSIKLGGSTKLTWASTNAQSCNGNFMTYNKRSGTVSVSPVYTTLYKYQCRPIGSPVGKNTVEKTVLVKVYDANSVIINLPTTVFLDTKAAAQPYISYNAHNATSCSGEGFTHGTYPGSLVGSVSNPGVGTTYKITCVGEDGTATAELKYPSGLNSVRRYTPSMSLFATENSVKAGKSFTLLWSSNNATTCTGTGFSTGGKRLGSVTLTPAETTTYTLTCTGKDGTATVQDKVTVIP